MGHVGHGLGRRSRKERRRSDFEASISIHHPLAWAMDEYGISVSCHPSPIRHRAVCGLFLQGTSGFTAARFWDHHHSICPFMRGYEHVTQWVR
jgi:hypothetical protein